MGQQSLEAIPHKRLCHQRAHSDQGFRVKDGFCFTQTALEGEEDKYGNRENDRVDAMIVIYTTFVNEYDMSETQRAAINKEHIETLQRCIEILKKRKNTQ